MNSGGEYLMRSIGGASGHGRWAASIEQSTDCGDGWSEAVRLAASGRKLAQEDFCQLAGKSRATHGENYKYDGSCEELARLLREYCPAWRVESERLFGLIGFNYVCGNDDAHLENFPLLETPFVDSALSPAYDLLCTTLHLHTESRSALEMFDDFTAPSFDSNGFVKRSDFLELAIGFGLRAGRAEVILSRITSKRSACEALLERSLLSLEARASYHNVLDDRLRAMGD